MKGNDEDDDDVGNEEEAIKQIEASGLFSVLARSPEYFNESRSANRSIIHVLIYCIDEYVTMYHLEN